jgi:hypothetical protein
VAIWLVTLSAASGWAIPDPETRFGSEVAAGGVSGLCRSSGSRGARENSWAGFVQAGQVSSA